MLVMMRRRSAYVNWMYSESKLITVPSETLVTPQYIPSVYTCTLFFCFFFSGMSFFYMKSLENEINLESDQN